MTPVHKTKRIPWALPFVAPFSTNGANIYHSCDFCGFQRVETSLPRSLSWTNSSGCSSASCSSCLGFFPLSLTWWKVSWFTILVFPDVFQSRVRHVSVMAENIQLGQINLCAEPGMPWLSDKKVLEGKWRVQGLRIWIDVMKDPEEVRRR